MTKKTASKKIVYAENSFLVNAEYCGDRTGNYALRDKINEVWEFTTDQDRETNGNINSRFYFNIKKQTFEFSDESGLYFNKNYASISRMISPALLLYRLIATFFGAPRCEDNYKMIWHYTVKHKPSGKLLTLSEWKGAAGFWLPDVYHDKLTREFKDDIIALMNYLVSDKCAHPYDNLVAGSVA